MLPVMAGRFEGFAPATFAWFAGLEQDNSRDYFAVTREQYEQHVRGALTSMLEDLREDFGGEVRVFRQQRDLRFSPDRSPYKTRTYGVLEGSPIAVTGLYAEVSSRGLYAATGYYRLARDQLERYRAAVADEQAGGLLAASIAAVEQAGVEVEGRTLRGAPRGYARDHPRLELLQHTSLIAGRRQEATLAVTREAALRHVADTWRTAARLVAWLDDHVGPSTLPPEEPRRR
jgi:uncharacterized protein (TIGR02453 family)